MLCLSCCCWNFWISRCICFVIGHGIRPTYVIWASEGLELRSLCEGSGMRWWRCARDEMFESCVSGWRRLRSG